MLQIFNNIQFVKKIIFHFKVFYDSKQMEIIYSFSQKSIDYFKKKSFFLSENKHTHVNVVRGLDKSSTLSVSVTWFNNKLFFKNKLSIKIGCGSSVVK